MVVEAQVGYLDLQNRMIEEHNTIIAPLQAKSKVAGIATYDLTNKFKEDNGNFGVNADVYDSINVELSKNSVSSSLQFKQYNEEKEALQKMVTEMWQGQEILKDYALKYEPYNNRIKATYALSQEIKSQLTNFHDRDDILNCSISESYANGTGDVKKKPFYIIPPGDPKIKGAKLSYGAGMSPEGIPQITFNVSVQDVRNLNANGIVEQLALLQHFPALLEKFVFTCATNVTMEDGTILKIEQLRGDSLAMKWYSKFRYLKCSMFFFESRDVRAYIQIGDMKFEKADVQSDRIGLTGDNLQEVCQRLYDACYFFMVFCHNTGFDPIPYIDSILAESGLPIPLEEVIADFNEDLANGDIQITSTFV